MSQSFLYDISDFLKLSLTFSKYHKSSTLVQQVSEIVRAAGQ